MRRNIRVTEPSAEMQIKRCPQYETVITPPSKKVKETNK